MGLHHRWKGRRINECLIPLCRYSNPKRLQVVIRREDDQHCASREGLARVDGIPDDQSNQQKSQDCSG